MDIAPEFLSVSEVAKALGLGRSKTWEIVASGRIFSVREGTRRLIPREEIARWKADKIAEARAAAGLDVAS